jgi:hypothetical protein
MIIVEAYSRKWIESKLDRHSRIHFLRTYDLGAIGSHPSLLVFQYLSICHCQF